MNDWDIMKSPRAKRLDEIRECLSDGRLDQLKGDVIVNLDQASAQDLRTLLEVLQFKSFGHQLIAQENVVEQLERHSFRDELQRIRDFIHYGDYAHALEMLEAEPFSEDTERLVTKSRVLATLGRYDDTVELLLSLFQKGIGPINTRGVAFQVLGHAYLELNQLEKATACCKRALDLAWIIGNNSGKFSALVFLAKLAALAGKFDEARSHMDSAFAFCRENGPFRWLLGYYRTLTQVKLLARDGSCLLDAFAALILARALDDKLFISRGVIEISLLQRMLGEKMMLQTHAQEAALVEETAKVNGNDLPAWLASLRGIRPSNTVSTTLNMFMNGTLETVDVHPRLETGHELNWIFDVKMECFMDLRHGTVSDLKADGPPALLLLELHRSDGPVSFTQLFTKIWKLPWDERHLDLIKVNLGRLRKISPTLEIARKQNTLQLKSKGLLLP